MLSDDPRMNPKTANTLGSSELEQPYARRTIKTFLGFAIALILVGAFITWFIFAPENEEPVRQTDLAVTQEQALAVRNQMPGNEYEEETGRSAVYNFFYKLFAGIEDGLEDSPHNLNNIEELDDRNLDAPSNAILPVQSSTARTIKTQSASTNIPKFKYALSDIVDSEVFSASGDKTGQVFDILVNKNTGKARAIIVNDENASSERDLTAIGFEEILKQNPDGEVTLKITENDVNNKPEFNYSSIDNSDYISLRNLYDGQLLDYEGKVAGQIDGVIYENAEAQNIYFTLRPILAQQNQKNASTFQLPFKDTNIIKNTDGYDIKLTKEQTEALAKSLFTE